MTYKIRATKGSMTVGFVVGAVSLRQAIDMAAQYIEQETGVHRDQLDDLQIIQQDKETNQPADAPGQQYVPGTEPSLPAK